jgi:nucleoid-associated protein YgaU
MCNPINEGRSRKRHWSCTMKCACYCIVMSRNICMVIAATLALVGCDMTNKEDTQYDDSRNPYYKKAQTDIETSPDAAIADYEAAIGANPKLTEAHYQLGHIYADKMNDPIGAIFHFEQYLKLAPTGSHSDEAKALIDKESQAFAASLPNSAPQSADEYAKLQADNASLRKQVEDATKTIVKLQGQLGKHRHDMVATAAAVVAADTNAPAATPPPAPTVAAADASAAVSTVAAAPAAVTDATAQPVAAATNAVAPPPPRALPIDATNAGSTAAPGTPGAPAADAGPSRSYKIVGGDSLWKIAHKMYPGDTKNGIDKIKEANKDVLIEGKPLKIGQVLVIPQ